MCYPKEIVFYLITKLDASENCDCPCLPKCCPKGKILVKNNDKIGTNHGFDCIDAPNDYSLPIVRMKHLNKTPSNQKFHPGVFPNCKGLATNWTYDFHFDGDNKNNIQLEIEDIYDGISILHLGQGDKISTSEMNNNEIRMILGNHQMKSLMFFCFDQMDITQTSMVG